MSHIADIAHPMHAIYWAWAIWYCSWLLSVLWKGRPTAWPDGRDLLPTQLATFDGTLLLFVVPSLRLDFGRLWTLAPPSVWLLFDLVVLAFLFCWWARAEMGPLWSGFVSRTERHRIIDTGPFALMRHPIYAGIGLAAVATAAAQGTLAGLAGAVILAFGCWQKARIEERFLSAELGAAAYDEYRRRVPMLVPFLFKPFLSKKIATLRDIAS